MTTYRTELLSSFEEGRVGLRRRKAQPRVVGLEQFFTKDTVAKMCVDEFMKVRDDGLIVDPCCGNGSFQRAFDEYGIKIDNYDIDDTNFRVSSSVCMKQDFLDSDLPQRFVGTKVHIISNPPYGRNSTLVKKFIKVASLFSVSISFILPKSFKKRSLQRVFPPHFHLVKCIDLPKNSFTVDDRDVDVPSVFQIWVKKESEREMKEHVSPPSWFHYVRKGESPDFSIRRVGGTAGTLSSDVGDKNIQSHYFVKVDVDKETFVNAYSTVIFEFDNSVGPKSISKQELNEKLIELELR
jgi:predicted RNA methylase